MEVIKLNWTGKDTSLFMQQKEYIDTAIVPLISADFGRDIIQSAEQYEFIQLLVSYLEKQFKGRLIVTPPHAYLADRDMKAADAASWAKKLREADFKHIFFFTSDGFWQGREAEVGASVIWVPSVPLGYMEDNLKYSLIENQAKQVVNIITQKWQEKAL